MRPWRSTFLLCIMLLLNQGLLSAKDYIIHSPDKEITLKVEVNNKTTFSVFHKSSKIISPSPVSMTVRNRAKLGINPVVRDVKKRSVDQVLYPVLRVKSREVLDRFEEISLLFKGGYGLTFRAYDDGIAYRFLTEFDGDIEVLDEEVRFNFPGDHRVYFATEPSFFTHQERRYEYIPLSEIPGDKMCYPPTLVDIEGGPKVAIMEADLEDYPGLYLRGTNGPSLAGLFPAAALVEELDRDRDLRVTKRADYIAKTPGRRSFPWRALLIAEKDRDLLESQLVFKLAKPLQLKDPSWIKPGKVAWDWWNALNISGVDFKAGVNTETYKYYIDFAGDHGIEYVILDEGWYVLGDLLRLNPNIAMEEILDHARKKNVGIILWVIWKTLDDQLEEALDQFEKWGVKGLKVDFMQRDDQWMVNYYHKIAQEAAKRQFLLDFHGAYKPTGLRRAYPNVLTREGVLGLEHCKWSENVTPEHDLIIPFTRMLAGPMDYTPGAMVNAQKNNFKAIFERPMSQGTRCHQLAMYVVYESPLQMLCDSPSHYLAESECLEFLAKVPTVWDETRVLEARVSDYVLVARRSGIEWYLGAMTDWTARELEVDLSFLGEGSYAMEIFRDGVNADRYGNDYKKEVRSVDRSDKLTIRMAPGGGWAARIGPEQGASRP
ncbi:MAG: glycoside hydrolase family 97 protein [Candidatus Neomarinimicrobiota bacterium]